MLAEEGTVGHRDLTALVVCGGGPVEGTLPEAGLVVAADGGLSEAIRLGLRVDLLVGDMDSVSPDDLTSFEAGGGAVERHPADKDATDLELALQAVSVRGVGAVTVAGGSDGRLDHLLGNALTLTAETWRHLRLDAMFGRALVHVIREERTLQGRAGELISLFASGGPAKGVRTEGLRWNIHDEELLPGSGRGISNEFVTPEAHVGLTSGVLLAIRPGSQEAP